MNLDFSKSDLQYFSKIKLDRINPISQCTTPFSMPPIATIILPGILWIN